MEKNSGKNVAPLGRKLRERRFIKTNKKRIWFFLSENGMWYSQSMIAETLGIKCSTIFNRMKRNGWDSPNVLKDRKDEHITKVKKATTKNGKRTKYGRFLALKNMKVGSWEQANL